MKEQLDQLRADLEELEKTPLMLKPARAEKAVRRSFEIVSELAQTVEQLRFKVEAMEGGLITAGTLTDEEKEDIRSLGLDPEYDGLDPIDREALAKMKADNAKA